MKRAVLVVALLSITLFSCSPSPEGLSLVVDSAEEIAEFMVAGTMMAVTAEFESKLELALQQTLTALPTNTDTATATITSSPTYTQTFTPIPLTDTPVPPTDTLVPPTPEPLAIVNVDSGNLRSGPGTVYTVVAQLDEGTELVPLERNEDADWFRVEVEGTGEQGWISHTIVDINFAPETIAVAQSIPSIPTATPTLVAA